MFPSCEQWRDTDCGRLTCPRVPRSVNVGIRICIQVSLTPKRLCFALSCAGNQEIHSHGATGGRQTQWAMGPGEARERLGA